MASLLLNDRRTKDEAPTFEVEGFWERENFESNLFDE